MNPEPPPPDAATDQQVQQPPPQRHSRRTMLKVVGAGAVGAAVGVGGTRALTRIKQPALAKWRFLTEAEAVLAEAICEQIIPADQDPGAKDAGCVNFIDKQLVGPYRRHQGAYRTGLACVQKTSQALHQKDFEKLTADEQLKLLQALEGNKAPEGIWKEPAAGAFFGMMVQHTMQGFYGSPRHGGNKDYASYKMLGLEYPRVMGRNKHA